MDPGLPRPAISASLVILGIIAFAAGGFGYMLGSTCMIAGAVVAWPREMPPSGVSAAPLTEAPTQDGYSIRGYTLYRRVVRDPEGHARPLYAFLRTPQGTARPSDVPEGYRVVFDASGRPCLQRIRPAPLLKCQAPTQTGTPCQNRAWRDARCPVHA